MSACRRCSAGPGSIPSSSTSVRRGVRLQRVRLPARAVEREHDLAAQALAQRVLGDQRLELGHDGVVIAEREVSVDALLERDDAKLFEPARLGFGIRLVRDLGVRRPAPQRERVVQEPGAVRGLAIACVAQRRLEPGRVDLPRVGAQHVTGRARDQHVLAEQPAQLGNRVVERRARRARRLVAPELVDDAIGRDDVVRPDEQRREERALPLAGDLDELAVALDLERPQDAEFDHRLLVTLARGPRRALLAAR